MVAAARSSLLHIYQDVEPAGVPAPLYTGLLGVSLAAAVVAFTSLVVRFRRATGAERAQIKWLVLAVVAILVGVPLAAVSISVFNASELVGDAVFGLFIALLPASVGVAILKYRLYDIDRLINRTIVYGLLTAVLAACYASGVLVSGQLLGGTSAKTPSWAVAGATLAMAGVFQPARRTSSARWTGASTAATTTQPRPSTPSAAAFVTNLTRAP